MRVLACGCGYVCIRLYKYVLSLSHSLSFSLSLSLPSSLHLDSLGIGDEFFVRGHVDAHKAGMPKRRTADAYVDGLGGKGREGEVRERERERERERRRGREEKIKILSNSLHLFTLSILHSPLSSSLLSFLSSPSLTFPPFLSN